MYLFRNSRYAFILTLAMIALGVLLIHNTTIYFRSNTTPAFLLEKGAIADGRLWRNAFYFHIISSSVVLVAGTLIFFLTNSRHRKLHLLLGYVYINGVLWIAAPTGLILSPFSKGGWPGAAGFALTGIAWWYSTWRGYSAIRQKRVNDHIAWMVRSWCISLSAISFRLIHMGLFLVGIQPLINYVLSIWLSLLANVLFAEYFIARNLELDRPPRSNPDHRIAIHS